MRPQTYPSSIRRMSDGRLHLGPIVRYRRVVLIANIESLLVPTGE